MRTTRRSYTEAVTGPAAGGGHAVLLDGRPLRTPLGRPVVVAAQGLAAALAGEWAAQGDTVRPRSMPLFRLVCTALDRTAERPGDLVDGLLRFVDTDLLCYRAEAPAELAARQRAAWQPLLDWLADRHAARLRVTTGILPVTQPAEAAARLRGVLDRLDPLPLTGLAEATAAAGSLVVGLALHDGRIDAAQAFEIAQLDETYQMELWGADEAAAARRDALSADLAAAERLIRLATAP